MFKKFLPFNAPADWYFIDPDTGKEFFGKDKQEIIGKILEYRSQNQLEEIPLLGETIENFLCNFPVNLGKCGKVKLERNFWGYIKGGITLVKNVLVKNFVSQEEADRRASICLKCPHNVFPDKRGFIKWSDRLAEASVPDKKVRGYDQLGNCEACSCPLRVKTWVVGPFKLEKEEKEKMKKVGCWQIVE